MPIGSAVIGGASALILTETINVGALIFAAPIASMGMAFRGAVNAFDKKRSGLSRIFSAAAAVVGVIGAVAPFAIAGPEALGALVISLGATALAGAFNVVSYAIRNKKLPFSVSIRKNPPPAAPAAPAAPSA
jgi:hypothetical protein